MRPSVSDILHNFPRQTVAVYQTPPRHRSGPRAYQKVLHWTSRRLARISKTMEKSNEALSGLVTPAVLNSGAAGSDPRPRFNVGTFSECRTHLLAPFDTVRHCNKLLRECVGGVLKGVLWWREKRGSCSKLSIEAKGGQFGRQIAGNC